MSGKGLSVYLYENLAWENNQGADPILALDYEFKSAEKKAFEKIPLLASDLNGICESTGQCREDKETSTR